MTTRRQFIGASAALLGASAVGATSMLKPADRKLSILFLGGTGFIGPHQINRALDRGHTVTMFNRGSNSGLYGDRVEELIGNRDARIDDGLKVLQGDRRWDVVVDNSGYVPRHVRDTAELLKDRCDRYIYTSTVGVYDFDQQRSVDINSPLLAAPEPDTEEVTGETYGPLKAECDRIVQSVLGDKATVVRPTYIIGPGDRTDRFTYWVDRFHRGGDIVCPAGADLNATWVDVRDLCHWLITLAENNTPGIFNASGPVSPVSNQQLMWALRAFTGAEVNLHWPPSALLEELEYATPMFGFSDDSIFVDSSAAQAAGLEYRPLADSVRDIQEWWTSQTEERRNNARGWPTAEQEKAVLARMKA
jgi:2'-hydroxyisoflavone reductase